MSSLMHFGPWAARVEYDEDIGSFHGVVINTRDTITFYGDSIAALREEFANSVNAHFAFCEKHGVEPLSRRTSSRETLEGVSIT